MDRAIVASQVDDESAPNGRGDAFMREELQAVEQVARMLAIQRSN
jgi:hypothetical protein